MAIPHTIGLALRSIRRSLEAWSGGTHFAKVFLHPVDAIAIRDMIPLDLAPGRERKSVYLCGPMAGCTDEEMTAWREELKLEFSDLFDFLDPCRRDYRENDTAHAALIVDADLEDIRNCDILFAFSWKRSYGTIMEIPYAAFFNRTIVVVCPDTFFSPWLKYHADYLVHTMAQGREVLRLLGAPL